MINDDKVKIFQRGEKVLRRKAKEIPPDEIKSEKNQKIISKLEKVIFENDEAVAAAAPQIGESLKIFAVSEWLLHRSEEKPKTEFKNVIFVNPKIIKISKGKKFFPEGCLSAADWYGEVQRAQKVKVEAYDRNGKKFLRGASGVMAQTIQHEIDHLNGVLFIDKAKNLTKHIQAPKI